MEEFYRQGDREKTEGLEVSAFFDRDKPEQLDKAQVRSFTHLFTSPLSLTSPDYYGMAAHAEGTFVIRAQPFNMYTT